MKNQYKTVPVDIETHSKLMALCKAYELGKRAQGAIVRRLVNAEYRKLSSGKQLLAINNVNKE
jgi:hypothetical protein